MGLLTPLAIRIGAIPWMPRFLPQIVAVDKLLQRLTRGRVTVLDIAGLPNLMLTVAGRKSGIPRESPLLCVPYGDGFLIAGSYFGGPKTPAWVANLEAAGVCSIRFKGRTMRATSRRLEAEERRRAWAHMLRTWPNFARYEKRTSREIKVFLLSPIPTSKD
ncbi:MAG TPA: nitroreductase family deazaflavin-dependent oxidoreductase [Nocardioidaceae bacterium]|nr:nitroreductase family deazaflavin-dependent oxidoreductase [Nocardioidaceae bacterium]